MMRTFMNDVWIILDIAGIIQRLLEKVNYMNNFILKHSNLTHKVLGVSKNSIFIDNWSQLKM